MYLELHIAHFTAATYEYIRYRICKKPASNPYPTLPCNVQLEHIFVTVNKSKMLHLKIFWFN